MSREAGDPSRGRIRMFGPTSGTGSGTAVRPGRVRNRSKTETGEKIKKPAEDSRKKPPATRKAPARGRYVDEYAQPGA
ncbi:MAG: hypothetical protein ACLGHA_01860 [Gammaproteobacteria bacterium]